MLKRMIINWFLKEDYLYNRINELEEKIRILDDRLYSLEKK